LFSHNTQVRLKLRLSLVYQFWHLFFYWYQLLQRFVWESMKWLLLLFGKNLFISFIRSSKYQFLDKNINPFRTNYWLNKLFTSHLESNNFPKYYNILLELEVYQNQIITWHVAHGNAPRFQRISSNHPEALPRNNSRSTAFSQFSR